LQFTLFYIEICFVAIYALLLLAKNCARGEKLTNMYEVCSSSLLSHQLLATISLALGGLVRREADPEADADPHRRHGHHRRHHSSSYYRPSYSSNYQGYNNYNNYNNNNYRPNTPIRDLLPLKAAALAGAVGGFKVASILG